MRLLEDMLDKTGHSKMHFPLLIPEDLFAKESRHLRGFEDQVFWMGKVGKRRLTRKLVLRPTSETAMYPMFSLWVRSHRDLPIKVYQTVSVFRYETGSTKALIRDREMWPFNEAHTVHATLEEAEKQMEIGTRIYEKLFRKLALPYLLVRKPEWELFPGAVNAYEFYVLMPDRKVLETGSVNNLGQAFSKVFDIKYERTDGSHEYAYQTCYGQSERLLACVVAVHGDDHGLVLPPSIAPILVVVVPIVYAECAEKVEEYARRVERLLKKNKVAVVLDEREDFTPGEKFYYWEKMGIPIRLEIGLREAENETVTLVRRNTLKRETVRLQSLAKAVRRRIKGMEEELWNRAEQSLREKISDASTIEKAIQQIKNGKAIIETTWCGREKCRRQIENMTGIEIIGFAVTKRIVQRKCLVCGDGTKNIVCLAKSN